MEPTSSIPLPPDHLERERNRLSVERTRLSLERTFLSWIRTGLTGIALGIAIARFLVFKNVTNQTIGHNLGLMLVLWGMGIFIFALFSYRSSYRELYPDNSGRMTSFWGHTVAMLTLIIITLMLSFILLN